MEDRLELYAEEFKDYPFLTNDDCIEYEEDKEETQGWIIDDDVNAGWALRQYSLLDAELERKKNLAKEEQERIKAWLGQEQEKIEKKQALLSQSLSGYLYQLRRDNPKAKIDTPFGTVTTRKTPAKWTYDDETVIKFLHPPTKARL